MQKMAWIFGLILALCPVSSLYANEDTPNPLFPADAQISFEWDYTCPSGQGCSFACPGTSGANRVTKLQLYLGSLPTGKDQRSPAIFFNFSTQVFPQSNGFSISTGIGVLTCQVNGMKLDYSGPPK